MQKTQDRSFSEKVEDFILRQFYILSEVVLPETRLLWEKYLYLFLEYVDPAPKKRNKEIDTDWYKRIDIKYALRHAKYFYLHSKYTNGVYESRLVPENLDRYPKKFQNQLKELAKAVNRLAYRCEDNFRILQIKKRTLEQMEEDSN